MPIVMAILAGLTVPDGEVCTAADIMAPIMAFEYAKTHNPGTVCVCLSNDYGFFINWPDAALPEIYLYEKKPARITLVTSVDEFLKWIASLPEDATLDWIRTCDGTCAGMPEEKTRHLQRILEGRKRHLTSTEDGNFVVCTCESIHRTRFKDIDEARKWMDEHPDAVYEVAGKRYVPQPQPQTSGNQKAAIQESVIPHATAPER